MSDTSKFKVNPNSDPDPKSVDKSIKQPKMKSNSQLRREAIQEDEGKI